MKTSQQTHPQITFHSFLVPSGIPRTSRASKDHHRLPETSRDFRESGLPGLPRTSRDFQMVHG